MPSPNENMFFNIYRQKAEEEQRKAEHQRKREELNRATNVAKQYNQTNKTGYNPTVSYSTAREYARQKSVPTQQTLAMAHYGDEVDQQQALDQILRWFQIESGIRDSDLYNREAVEDAISRIENKPGNKEPVDRDSVSGELIYEVKPDVKKKLDYVREALWGNKKSSRLGGKFDISKNNISEKDFERSGATKIYDETAKAASKWAQGFTEVGKLNRQKVIDAVASGVHNDNLYQQEPVEELKKLLRTAYVSYNKTGDERYNDVCAKLARELLNKAYGGGATPQQCIDYELMILAISQSADADGGPYVDRARYGYINNHVRKLREMAKDWKETTQTDDAQKLEDLPGSEGTSARLKKAAEEQQEKADKSVGGK